MDRLIRRAAVLSIVALLSFSVSGSISAEEVTLTTIMPAAPVYYNTNTNERNLNIVAGSPAVYDYAQTLTMPVKQGRCYRVWFTGEVLITQEDKQAFLGAYLHPGQNNNGVVLAGANWSVNTYDTYTNWQIFVNVYIFRANGDGYLQFLPLAYSLMSTCTLKLANTNIYVEEINAVNITS